MIAQIGARTSILTDSVNKLLIKPNSGFNGAFNIEIKNS